MTLAQEHHAAGRLTEAQNTLLETISAAPDFHPAYHLLGLIAFNAGNLSLATELVAKAISINHSVAIYHRNLAELCRRLGRLNIAIQAANRACELAPNDSEAHYNLGLILSDSSDWAAAISAYTATLAINKNHGKAWNNLGVAEDKLGHQTEAEKAYLNAVQVDPHNQEAQRNLYVLYQQLGKTEQAKLHLEAANLSAKNAAAISTPAQNKQTEVIQPPHVTVRDTGTARGRGVFAQCNFSAGDVIESSPVVIFESPFAAFPPELRTIVFSWGALCKIGTSHAVVLGYGSLYNHHDPANMYYQPDANNMTMKYIAVREILAGEELTVNYNAAGGNATWNDNNWFDRMNITPII